MFTESTIMKVAAMLAMAPLSTYGHMIMFTPKPFGKPNSSPLLPDGTDFPCKNVPYTFTEMNNWAVGSEQLLSFNGTAVHGGGSCQISVTTDKEPTAASKFKVIYSIEGGCPAAVGGNLIPGSGDQPATYPFTIPPEVPNGQGTVVWTWFNRIGNREMYANCAPIMVTGGSDDTIAFDALPDMAVANIAVPGACQTAENAEYLFENPGTYKTSGGAKDKFGALCGGVAGSASAPAPGSGPGAGPDPAPAPAPAPQQPSANPGIPTPGPAPNAGLVSTLRTVVTVTAPMAPTTPAGNAGPSLGHSHADGEECSEATSAAPPTQPTQAPNNTVPAAQPTQAPPAEPTQAPTAPGSSNPDANGTPCSPDGAVICNGETQFGLCNWGKVIFQPVAAGTKCNNGVIAKRDYSHRNMRTVY